MLSAKLVCIVFEFCLCLISLLLLASSCNLSLARSIELEQYANFCGFFLYIFVALKNFVSVAKSLNTEMNYSKTVYEEK